MDKKNDLLELQQAFAGLSVGRSNKLVEATKKQLRSAKADDNGIVITGGKHCLDIRVTKSSIDRALGLLNTLFAVLEQRGFSIEIGEDKKTTRSITFLKYAGEKVQIHVEEPLNRTPHVLTDAENKKLTKKEALHSNSGNYSGYRNDWHLYSWEPPKWDYSPSGQLQFKIDNLQSSRQRQNWSDSTEGTDKQLESLLPIIAYWIIQGAAYLRNQTLERQERERRWAEEARQKAERERQRLEEQERIDHLEKLLKQWSKREEIMQFLSWLDVNISDDRRTEDFTRWYEWAESYAQRLCPLTKTDFFQPERPRYRY